AAIVEEELTRFSLRGMQKRYPAQLSGGQQQRVALARMLAAKPDILMLDEPFSALDAHLKSVLEQNLISLFDSFEGTILYVSHDIDEALRFCDRIAVVDAGRIVEIDTGDDLIHRPSSLAALKLSGCKNITPAQYVDDSTAYLPAWGVTIKVPAPLPKDVTNIGFRAAAILPMPAGAHGENCFEFQVDKLSDDRFYRMMMVHFTQTDGSVEYVSDNRDEMRYLKQHVFWRVDREALPIMAAAGLRFEVGSRAVGQIPVEAIYEVTR
ncbi:MAG: ATP-binding cassette domain-containing protein, partial [Coriobacteriales bacterium]|nr:ATP-binding cassette domain-containing protein [Coriobacteriales bacterium]